MNGRHFHPSGDQKPIHDRHPATESLATLSADRLRRAMHGALAARGLSSRHIEDVAEGLLTTSLRGVDTHGLRLFPLYLRELDGGRARVTPDLRWHQGGSAARLLDADGALGLVAGMEAARAAIQIATEHGVGVVAVSNSNHFGAASVYTLAMAAADMIGFSFTNSDALVAPFGGKAPLLGTNPLSCAVPGADGECFCLDMATSQIAYSKIKAYRAEGKPLEPGWAIDADGADAAGTIPSQNTPSLSPLGGYKGQGLGMLVAILCTLLTGMPPDHLLSHLYVAPYDQPRQVGHFFMALNIASFQGVAGFKRGLKEYLDLMRGQEPIRGSRVIAPGDLERESTRIRLDSGVPLEPALYEFFLQIEKDPAASEL